MNLLFLGGTGLISSACVEHALACGHQVTVVNRAVSDRYPVPHGATLARIDVRKDEASLRDLAASVKFDCVIDFIAYTEQDIERDLRAFSGHTGQFIFISSASAYQKPPASYLVTEETPLENPFWQYSRDKIACERRLMHAWAEEHFPVTIVRPSLTYGPSQIPFPGGSWEHPWTIIDRMKRGAPLFLPGDGSSLWVLTWNMDFAQGFTALLGRPQALGQAYHITSDEVQTWDRIALEVYKALGAEPNIIHIPSDLMAAYDPELLGPLTGDKSNSLVFDNAKIRTVAPSFECKVRWAEGVRRSLSWFEASPARRTIDQAKNDQWDRIIAGYQRAWEENDEC